jgi:hypothetical protein
LFDPWRDIEHGVVTAGTYLGVQKEIVTSFAGAAAERRYRELHPEVDWQVEATVEASSGMDGAGAAKLASYFAVAGEERDAFLRWLAVRAENVVGSEWLLVTALANLLVRKRKLSGERFQQFLTKQVSSK